MYLSSVGEKTHVLGLQYIVSVCEMSHVGVSSCIKFYFVDCTNWVKVFFFLILFVLCCHGIRIKYNVIVLN